MPDIAAMLVDAGADCTSALEAARQFTYCRPDRQQKIWCYAVFGEKCDLRLNEPSAENEHRKELQQQREMDCPNVLDRLSSRSA